MSFAIALENSPENVGNIQSTLQILRTISETPAKFSFLTVEQAAQVDELIDWYEDMHKVLTEYPTLAEQTFDNEE